MAPDGCVTPLASLRRAQRAQAGLILTGLITNVIVRSKHFKAYYNRAFAWDKLGEYAKSRTIRQSHSTANTPSHTHAHARIYLRGPVDGRPLHGEYGEYEWYIHHSRANTPSHTHAHARTPRGPSCRKALYLIPVSRMMSRIERERVSMRALFRV